jgi:hypothetical protein
MNSTSSKVFCFNPKIAKLLVITQENDWLGNLKSL